MPDSQIPYNLVCQTALETDPEIIPGLVGIGLVKGGNTRFDQECLPLAQGIPLAVRLKDPFSGNDIVDQVIKTHIRAKAVPGKAD